jgi:hypothetical protein
MMNSCRLLAAELPQASRGNGVSRAVNQATPGLPGDAKSTFIFAFSRNERLLFHGAIDRIAANEITMGGVRHGHGSLGSSVR